MTISIERVVVEGVEVSPRRAEELKTRIAEEVGRSLGAQPPEQPDRIRAAVEQAVTKALEGAR